MIICKSPFRISYIGGGTDFKGYYNKNGGAVISTAINKYIYVAINSKFDGKVHLRYSQIEEVDIVNQLQHNIVREALKMFGINDNIEIVITSDIPSKGCGLGSSSALSVALINAISRYTNQILMPKQLAEMACNLEINILNAPIGKQDQYACAFGGLRKYVFHNDENVDVQTYLETSQLHELERCTMLFYLGYTRSANDILQKHTENILTKSDYLDSMMSLVYKFDALLLSSDNVIEQLGELISASWEYKKQMSDGYSSNRIDNIIAGTLNEGAYGAKLCGAGGGGFMLVLCEPEKQQHIRNKFEELQELKFNFHNNGSEIIYDDNQRRKL